MKCYIHRSEPEHLQNAAIDSPARELLFDEDTLLRLVHNPDLPDRARHALLSDLSAEGRLHLLNCTEPNGEFPTELFRELLSENDDYDEVYAALMNHALPSELLGVLLVRAAKKDFGVCRDAEIARNIFHHPNACELQRGIARTMFHPYR